MLCSAGLTEKRAARRQPAFWHRRVGERVVVLQRSAASGKGAELRILDGRPRRCALYENARSKERVVKQNARTREQLELFLKMPG